MPDPCAKCLHLSIANGKEWWRWMCILAPLPQTFNPVTGKTVADPPYRLCKSVREKSPECPEFENGPNQLRQVNDGAE